MTGGGGQHGADPPATDAQPPHHVPPETGTFTEKQMTMTWHQRREVSHARLLLSSAPWRK
ncbi:hypothetical protein GGP41_002071 [Bipolaris sorokiniana]|uniref:Uncharacterized protein n=1 Tax=Cochliobolus sativus TaxID=45130 RepID=A0A8H5ZTE6_COCSA|nr:hypothetical protein GGP41_002071 [Bipolaris sorokiniana]